MDDTRCTRYKHARPFARARALLACASSNAVSSCHALRSQPLERLPAAKVYARTAEAREPVSPHPSWHDRCVPCHLRCLHTPRTHAPRERHLLGSELWKAIPTLHNCSVAEQSLGHSGYSQLSLVAAGCFLCRTPPWRTLATTRVRALRGCGCCRCHCRCRLPCLPAPPAPRANGTQSVSPRESARFPRLVGSSTYGLRYGSFQRGHMVERTPTKGIRSGNGRAHASPPSSRHTWPRSRPPPSHAPLCLRLPVPRFTIAGAPNVQPLTYTRRPTVLYTLSLSPCTSTWVAPSLATDRTRPSSDRPLSPLVTSRPLGARPAGAARARAQATHTERRTDTPETPAGGNEQRMTNVNIL